MLDRLKGIRLKIKRAKHHISDCEVLARAPNKSGFYGLKPEQDPKTGDIFYRIWFPRDPPDEFALVAGEAIHQLRSSLDHLAWQLVEANGGLPDDKTGFPICKTPPKKKAGFERKVMGICPGAISVINALQPYQSGDDALWKLQELNNIDKHRFLYVAIHALADATVHRSKPAVPGAETTVTASFSGSQRVMLQNGAIVIGITKHTKDTSQVNENFNVTFDIAFRDPQIVQGESVLPLLHQFVGFIDGVVNQFIGFL
jgi:hypothetical protein